MNERRMYIAYFTFLGICLLLCFISGILATALQGNNDPFEFSAAFWGGLGILILVFGPFLWI